jgi:hypothetical protein
MLCYCFVIFELAGVKLLIRSSGLVFKPPSSIKLWYIFGYSQKKKCATVHYNSTYSLEKWCFRVGIIQITLSLIEVIGKFINIYLTLYSTMNVIKLKLCSRSWHVFLQTRSNRKHQLFWGKGRSIYLINLVLLTSLNYGVNLMFISCGTLPSQLVFIFLNNIPTVWFWLMSHLGRNYVNCCWPGHPNFEGMKN